MQVKVPKPTAAAPEGMCDVLYVDRQRVSAVLDAMPSDDALATVGDLFAILSGTTRLRILFGLVTQPELCVCDLATIAGRTLAATSHQLQNLRRLGLVTFRMEGKLAYYRLINDLVREFVVREFARPPTRKRKAA